MKRIACWLAILCAGGVHAASAAGLPDWLVATTRAEVQAGARFELIVVAPAGTPLPAGLSANLRTEGAELRIDLRAEEPAQGQQGVYSAVMPQTVSGPVTLTLAGRSSSVLVVQVTPRAEDVVDRLAGRKALPEVEPPLSDYEPMYFVLGARDGYSARFQLSFKYRLFDHSAGLARDAPWLAGIYFGYTQNSLWDLSSESRAFRDTSYRPALFWKWERTDEKTWLDGFRTGLEHESNGREGVRSRSIDTVFVQPEWRWTFRDGARLEFAPKAYAYLDKEENPDINRYRGYVDWRLRYDTGHNWIATTVARAGAAGKGSLQVDLARRARDLKFGPVSGYLYIQYFTGYGEDILDYNVRRKSQLRVGFAIVP